MRDFNHTVNVLVQAYLNNTLEHGTCFACAVGNMVAAGLNKKVIPANLISIPGSFVWEDVPRNYYPGHNPLNQPGWGAVFFTKNRTQQVNPSYLSCENVRKEIAATGYTWEELAKIEYAFETCSFGDSADEYMFNGLMSVVDVLADIHGVDLAVKENAKALFVKA